ncbi:SAM hydrolase/SAM-dependent halogenase family protein [Candidatus Magnetominusculus dajiuhuensis]|uniref:SAM hydrolase/SAM-dependent halogenase family protein n=1 Tax=Candidatus Magnetominusculus dajiuhuensis TaxID=3137712 RepID=UPI003B432078
MLTATLLTDFGLADTFIAQMKGVMLSINPEVNIVDITHLIEPYNIRHGAVALGMSYKYFPEGTIHIAVVDPGVGSNRRGIVVDDGRYIFIGPDNGLFSVIYAENKYAQNKVTVYEITDKRCYRNPTGVTFHGRDVFAPTAALISNGLRPEEVGPPIVDYQSFDIIPPSKAGDNTITGEVLYIDRFGNIITNITAAFITGCGFKLNGRLVSLKENYAQGQDGQLHALINSDGYLELFIKQGSAGLNLRSGVKTGARITVELSD